MTLPGDLSQFGDIDIYLFDQLLRGRIRPGMRVLDAGCGTGRNLIYMLRQGPGSYDVFAADADPAAVQQVQRLAASLAPQLPAQNFVVAPVEQMPFPDAFADVVISSAVLHFARDDRQFDAMVREMWRVLKPGGMLWARLASTIGIADQVRPIAGRWSLLPDGSERYLADEPLLTEMTRKLGGRLLDPIKTTVVSNQRAMTTWVVGKL
jgi:ubiquinone/menaquinone biosynthesis C-methylase UbiE